MRSFNVITVCAAMLFSGAAFAETITNTTTVLGSDNNTYNYIGANYETSSLTVTQGEIASGYTLSFDYTTTFPGSETLNGQTINASDIFITTNAGLFGISLGDQTANGGVTSGFYQVTSAETSQNIWQNRSGFTYGFEHSSSNGWVASDTVITGGNLIGNVGVSSGFFNSGNTLNGLPVYNLDIELTNLTLAQMQNLENSIVFNGTADCANGAFTANISVDEPSSFTIIGVGVLFMLGSLSICSKPKVAFSRIN